MENKTFLTKEGYIELEQQIERLIQEFNENEKSMSYCFQNAAGDEAHDNGEFDALQQKEGLLVSQINTMKKRLLNATIIDVPELDDNQININDTVILRIICW